MFERIKNAIKKRLLLLWAHIKDGFITAKENPSFAAIVLVLASSTSDAVSIVNEFLPLIITFAVLGMVLGLLKKLGKF